MALVSVVTATYAGDDPAHLAEALDSVAAQTHRPLQLLVAADGDLTPAAERLLADRCSRHAWIEVHGRNLAERDLRTPGHPFLAPISGVP